VDSFQPQLNLCPLEERVEGTATNKYMRIHQSTADNAMFNFNSELHCFYLAPDIKKKSAGIQDSKKITVTEKKTG
jgi:hypothetical protein